MPKNPINYCNSVFYKIVCRDISIVEIYIGSTTNFKARKCTHASICQNEKAKGHNLKLYQFIRNNGGWENWDMIEVHRQSCTDSLESTKVERNYIELLGATLNSCIPSRTKKEWTFDNKEKLAIQKELNKEHLAIYKKEYRKNNKEKVAANLKKYCEINKEKIQEKCAETIICECGREITKKHRLRHLRSNFHKINNLKLLSNIDIYQDVNY